MILVNENGFQLCLDINEVLVLQEQLAKAAASSMKIGQSSFVLPVILQIDSNDYASKINFTVMNR